MPAERLAEGNAAMNVGGYVPAEALPVGTGFLTDAIGLHAATTAFTVAVAAAAALGALHVATRRTGAY